MKRREFIAAAMAWAAGCYLSMQVEPVEAMDYEYPYDGRPELFFIPDDLIQTPSLEMLTGNFLETDNRNYRRAGIRRLGELKNPAAVPILVQYYPNTVEYGILKAYAHPLIRWEIIKALERIDTPEAREFITAEFEKILAHKQDPVPNAFQPEYACSYFTAILDAVSKWDDDAVYGKLKNLVGDTKYHSFVREAAYTALCRMEMRLSKIGGLETGIDFLLARMTDPGVGDAADFQKGDKTEEAIRNSGMMRMLIEYGPAALPQLKARRAKIPETEKSRRLETIARAMERIEQRAKSEAKAREFWTRYWKGETGYR